MTAEYTVCLSVEEQDFSNVCLAYNIEQSDGEASVMLELWRMWSTPSLPSLPGLLWPGVVAPGRIFSMDQIELNYVITLN